MTKVIIEVSGGVVQGVYCRNKNIEVELVDWDNARDDEEYEKECKNIMRNVDKSKTYKDIL